MTIVRPTNRCNNYQKSIARRIASLCKNIPEERKQALAEELTALASIYGCGNEERLKAALNGLRTKNKCESQGKA